MIFETLLAAILVMSASLAGVLFLQKNAQSFLEQRLPFLISFSAGVIFVTAGGLSIEVFDLVSSLWVGVGLISLGYILAWSLQYIFPETHHHHGGECDHSKQVAKKIIVGDSIHNVADGVVLVVAFAASPVLGIAATISIFIHEALQEVSEFFVLRHAGYSVRKSLLINFASSSTILIGVLLGYLALASHDLEIMLLAVSAGFFLQIVIHDLLPRPSQHETSAQFRTHLALVVVGVFLMGLVTSALGESHSHEAGHEDSHADHGAEHLDGH